MNWNGILREIRNIIHVLGCIYDYFRNSQRGKQIWNNSTYDLVHIIHMLNVNIA